MTAPATARQRAPWILFCGAVGLLGAATFSAVVPPGYRATTEITIDPAGLDPDDMASLRATRVADGVLSRAAGALHLDRNEAFQRPSDFGTGSIREVIRDLLGDAPDVGPVPTEIDMLRKLVAVAPSENGPVIAITAENDDPTLAADVANAVARAYLAEEAEARARSTRAPTAKPEGDLVPLQTSIQHAEEAIASFQARNEAAGKSDGRIAEQQIKDATTALAKAHDATEQARARAQQVQGGAATDAEGTPQPAGLQHLRQTLDELRRRQVELGRDLGPRHPTMIELTAEIAQTQRAIQTEAGRLGPSAKKEYERAAAAEQAIRARLDTLRLQASGNAAAETTLHQLQGDLLAKRAVYEAYLRGVRQKDGQDRNATIDHSALITAAVPVRQSSTSVRALLPPIGLLGGFGIGLVTCALLPLRRRSR